MATKDQVEARLREMIDRLDQAGDDVHSNLARALPEGRRIQIDVPDLETSYWTELTDGRMQDIKTGPAPKADIKLTAKSEDLIAMIDGELGLFSSYLTGRIRIEAGLSDLLALRKLA